MRALPIAALSLATFLPCLASAAPAAGELGFASRMYGELASQPGNLLFSPTSIRLCLGLAYAGARGETATQLRTTLGLPEGKAAHDAVAAQLQRWDALATPDVPPGVDPASSGIQQYWEEELKRRTTVLKIANRLWAQKGRALRADYLALLKTSYRAEPATVDFAASPTAARAEINRWVSERTERKIPELLPPPVITKDTRAVLVNAIYLKASWQSPFAPRATKSEPFFVAPGKSVKTPLMHEVEHYGLSSNEAAQLLELPYADGKLSMVVVLPTAKDGLAAVEKKIAAGALPGWLKALTPERVDVTLPRFKFEGAFSLADVLRQLGMTLPFTFPGADFSGIDDTKQLFISAVVHKAMVDVDERGTEAAAATATAMAAGGMPQQPKTFRADHPFVFLIRDKETGAVLFMGRLVDPTR